MFDPHNINKMEEPPRSPVFPQLTGYNRKVCDSYFKSFPKTTAYLDKYCTAPPLLEIKSYKNIKYTHVTAKLIYKKDFPLLEEYFKEQSGKFKIKIDLLAASGRTICRFLIDGMDVKQYGLHVGMAMVFFGNYQKTAGRESLGYKLIDIKYIITGNLMNVVPFEVVDTMTMGNIDEFMKDYTKMLINANNGEGTFLMHKWTKDNSGNGINNSFLSSELLDNFFIRFGMKMFARRFKGKEIQGSRRGTSCAGFSCALFMISK